MGKENYTTLNHRKMNKTSMASLVNRIETNVNGLDSKEWQQDDQFMIFWNAMLNAQSDYQGPIGAVRKNSLTPTLENEQSVRYRAFQALKRANNVFAVSEVPEEKAAYNTIIDQLKALKIKIQNNKENQTTNYNLLIDKLRSTDFLAPVSLLKLDLYITRLETANSAFNATEQSSTINRVRAKRSVNPDSRQELFDAYQLLVNYVQAMNAIGKAPFNELFSAINEAREYFSRDIAYRNTLKKKTKEAKAAAAGTAATDTAKVA